MAYGSLAFGLLTGTFTEDHDFGGADWRARQGKMGSIKMFDALFGPETFPDNVRAVDELKGIAARYGKSLPQLALRWAISNPAVSTALVGCRTVAEVEDNVGAIGWSISDADLAEIDAIFERHGVDTDPRLLDRRRGVSPAPSSRARSRSSPAAPAASDAASSSGSSRKARSVVIADVDRERRRGVGRRARRGGRVQADRRRPTRTQVQDVVDFAVERFGGLHVMCNNAGIGGSLQAVPRRRLRATSTA